MTGEMAEIKAYLGRIRLMDKRIDAMQDNIEWLKETALRITPVMKEDVVSCSGSQDKLGDTVAKIADLRTEINQAIDAFVDEKAKIIRQLNRVKNPIYFEILHKRYIEYKKMDDIAAEMHYTTRSVVNKHGRALQAFKLVLEEEERNAGYEE